MYISSNEIIADILSNIQTKTFILKPNKYAYEWRKIVHISFYHFSTYWTVCSCTSVTWVKYGTDAIITLPCRAHTGSVRILANCLSINAQLWSIFNLQKRKHICYNSMCTRVKCVRFYYVNWNMLTLCSPSCHTDTIIHLLYAASKLSHVRGITHPIAPNVLGHSPGSFLYHLYCSQRNSPLGAKHVHYYKV